MKNLMHKQKIEEVHEPSYRLTGKS
jgi:hypothetical protein